MVENMAKKLRVGIIGAGNIATSAHLPAYQQLTDIVEVVAIADIVPERAKDAAEKYGIPHYYASVEELIAGSYIIRWTSVLSNRFDTTGFKKAYGELYKAFTKQTASRRFSISA